MNHLHFNILNQGGLKRESNVTEADNNDRVLILEGLSLMIVDCETIEPLSYV